jgi:pyruvate/2-oxoacid:ferredoxin oxidoreductase alpha subunit
MEGLSYIAGAELPCVVVSVDRGGPGLGNIAPEQADYHQVVWGGGHGNYRNVVLAPNSVQEMGSLTMLAFELADKYRNPVFLLTDGAIGQMMEPVAFPDTVVHPPEKPWALGLGPERRANLVSSIVLDPDELEQHNRMLTAKYAEIERAEVRTEAYRLDDAEIVIVGFGIVARVVRSAVDRLRREGIAAGLLRPITLWPFPNRELEEIATRDRVRQVLVVEMSEGQMVKDVRLAVLGRKPVAFYGRMGGNIPAELELVEEVKRLWSVKEAR